MTPSGERLRFGVFEFDSVTGELSRSGIRIALKNRSSRILTILMRHPGELVTRDELRQAVWGAGVHVSYDQAIDNAICEIRSALGESPHSPLYVETLARRGYRWIAPVSPTDAVPALEATHSIAVLPLTCASGAHGRYIADELTDEIITCLACEPGLHVISRTSVLPFKDAVGGLARIAEQIGAKLIVEGTVAVGGSHARVNVQLLDATADVHLWAASFEENFRNRLSMERDVASRVAAGIREALRARQA